MKRIMSVLVILILFVLSGSVVLAKGGGNGKAKGGNATGAVDKTKGKTAKETKSTKETVKAEKEKTGKAKEAKTRKVRTRDPKTGRVVTKDVPVSEEVDSNDKDKKTRTVRIRNPKTGRMVTKKVQFSFASLLQPVMPWIMRGVSTGVRFPRWRGLTILRERLKRRTIHLKLHSTDQAFSVYVTMPETFTILATDVFRRTLIIFW